MEKPLAYQDRRSCGQCKRNNAMTLTLVSLALLQKRARGNTWICSLNKEKDYQCQYECMLICTIRPYIYTNASLRTAADTDTTRRQLRARIYNLENCLCFLWMPPANVTLYQLESLWSDLLNMLTITFHWNNCQTRCRFCYRYSKIIILVVVVVLTNGSGHLRGQHVQLS